MEPEAEAPGSDERSRPGATGGAYTPPILDRIPPLGLVAAAAALLDLLLRRGLLRTLSGQRSRCDALFCGRALDVPLNLSALAGVAAMAGGLYPLLAARLVPPWEARRPWERLSSGLPRSLTAGLAGIFLPSIAIG